MARRNNKKNREYDPLCRALTKDSVRVSVPRGFLSTLTHFFHHVSDALAGDDRPDHGLAMMRKGREYYRIPFYLLYGKLRRASKKMRPAQERKADGLFYQYRELSNEKIEKVLRKKRGSP